MEEQSESDRFVRVESALMHLDHQYRQMHEALISQQRQIDSLRRLIEQFRSALEREQGLAPEDRDPAEEKPPHY